MEIIARIDYYLLKKFTQTELRIKLWLTDSNGFQFEIEEVDIVKEVINKYHLLDRKRKPVDIDKRMCIIKFEKGIFYFIKYINEEEIKKECP